MNVSVRQLSFVWLIAGVLLSCSKVQAQHNATMYFMRDLPLVNTLNPAFQPSAGSVYVGLPFISSVYLDGGVTAQGATINNLFNPQANLRRIADGVGAYEGAFGSFELNLFNLGILVRDMYFTLDIVTKSHGLFSVPGEVIRMAWRGNAPYIGQAVSLDGLGGKAEAYTEIALGFSKEVMRDKITVGGKVKGLLGHAYAEAYLGKKSFIYTDPDSWNITAGLAPDISIGGFSTNIPNGDFSRDTIHFDSFKPIAGVGAGVDVGFEIKNDKVSISGSILNLGAINWKNASRAEAAGSMTFRGIQNNGNGFESGEDIIAQVKDSLFNIGTLRGSKGDMVRWIDPTIMFGVSYQLHEHFTGGALAAMTISKYHSFPLFALSVNTQKFPINGSLSYSYSSSHNLGMGVLFGQREKQLHIICDNMLAVAYRSTRHFNLRMGLNLLVGEPKNTSERKKDWGLLSPTKQEIKEEKRAARKAAKENKDKKPLGPLNPISEMFIQRNPSKATLNTPAGEEEPRPTVKDKKPLN